jgi:FkbM family methyltransferase
MGNADFIPPCYHFIYSYSQSSLSCIGDHLMTNTEQQAFLRHKIGDENFASYLAVKAGDRYRLQLGNHLVWLRKGTPDLYVAISCLLDGEFDMLSKYLDASFEGIIVDAGGYIGTAALAFSRMFPLSQIVSIEPSQSNAEILRLNVAAATNIHVVQGALVGGNVDEVHLRNRGTGAWGFTVVENPLDKISAEIIHKVPAYNLKKLGLNPADIGVLKLDIEGGELDLLTHDMESLQEIEIVVAELHDRIVSGCTQAFKKFSEKRLVLKDRHEKYFSIKK